MFLYRSKKLSGQSMSPVVLTAASLAPVHTRGDKEPLPSGPDLDKVACTLEIVPSGGFSEKLRQIALEEQAKIEQEHRSLLNFQRQEKRDAHKRLLLAHSIVRAIIVPRLQDLGAVVHGEAKEDCSPERSAARCSGAPESGKTEVVFVVDVNKNGSVDVDVDLNFLASAAKSGSWSHLYQKSESFPQFLKTSVAKWVEKQVEECVRQHVRLDQK